MDSISSNINPQTSAWINDPDFNAFKKDVEDRKQMILFVGAGINYSTGTRLLWVDVMHHLFCNALQYIAREKGIDGNTLKKLKALWGISSNNEKNNESGNNDLYKTELLSFFRNHILGQTATERNLNILLDGLSMLKYTATNEFPLLIQASIVKAILGEHYIMTLQDYLYGQCNKSILYRIYTEDYLSGTVPPEKRRFKSLFFLADWILHSETVRAVVTYNYDNFLSEAIKIVQERSSDGKCRKITVKDIHGCTFDESTDEHTFCIYHIHGYIPAPGEMMPVSNDDIVLSLEEIYEFSRDVYSWQTATQLHFLSHYTCLFFGVALSDMTMQRMIHFANKIGNRDKIYYLTAFPKSDRIEKTENEEYKKSYSALFNIKRSFFEHYGLTLLYDENGYDSLYERVKYIISPDNEKNQYEH